jgi:hypothetical protein
VAAFLHRDVTLDATAVVSAPPSQVFEFLTDAMNQCWIADSCIDVIARAPHVAVTGAGIRLHGPGGVRRYGELRVLGSHAPDNVLSLIESESGARWFLFWEVAPSGEEVDGGRSSAVRLRAIVRPSGLRDRLLLAAGGSRWLRGRAARALHELDFVLGGGRPRTALAAR